MLARLKPYPSTKDSGFPWLGRIPEHWVILRGKAIFNSIELRSETGDEELLTVSSERGVVPRRTANVTMFKAESYAGYKLCWPDDLVINSLWAWARGLGVSSHHGIVSSAYGVYRLRPGFQTYAQFIHELVRSVPFNWELRVRSKGIWTSRLQLTDGSFLGAPFPLPSPEELPAIKRFLDYVNRRIQRYIRAKQKLIKLFEEQRQAIIHRAVTRGLDPDVLLKRSGVNWLGDIPEEWEMKRLKSLVRIRYGLGQPPRESQSGPPLIRATNVSRGRILDANLVRVDPNDVPKSSAFLSEGEIIVVRSGAYTADSAIIPKEYGGAVAGFDMVVSVRKAMPEFIALALLSTYVRDDQLITASMRAAQPHLNADELGTAFIAVPPEVEQARIVEYVSRETRSLDDSVRIIARQIDLAREYRSRLIADVVTGKVEVREAAAGLPDEPEGEEFDALDERDISPDFEESAPEFEEADA